jgi:hypothetical protein
LNGATSTELRAPADVVDHEAELRLAELSAKRGDFAPLRALADVGDGSAARLLVAFLLAEADIKGLRHEVKAGTAGAPAALREAEAGGLEPAD